MSILAIILVSFGVSFSNGYIAEKTEKETREKIEREKALKEENKREVSSDSGNEKK